MATNYKISLYDPNKLLQVEQQTEHVSGFGLIFLIIM